MATCVPGNSEEGEKIIDSRSTCDGGVVDQLWTCSAIWSTLGRVIRLILITILNEHSKFGKQVSRSRIKRKEDPKFLQPHTKRWRQAFVHT
jgi:hypothetical protein